MTIKFSVSHNMPPFRDKLYQTSQTYPRETLKSPVFV
jgi:hypothetical protein